MSVASPRPECGHSYVLAVRVSALAAAMAAMITFVAAPTLAAAQRTPAPAARSARDTTFRVEETTIAGVEEALHDGRLTCHDLVSRYLRRIEVYDKNGPAVNALILVNPDALRLADSLDARARTGAPLGTLPAGLSFFGRAWSEPTLFRLAYGYEQATRQRRPPASTPPLR